MIQIKLNLKDPKYCNGCRWLRDFVPPSCSLLFSKVKIYKELVDGKQSGKFHRPEKCIEDDEIKALEAQDQCTELPNKKELIEYIGCYSCDVGEILVEELAEALSERINQCCIKASKIIAKDKRTIAELPEKIKEQITINKILAEDYHKFKDKLKELEAKE